MTTTQYVARCSICGVAPFSTDPAGFTLKRFDRGGRPTSDPDGGELFCQLHYPPRTSASRPPAQTPLEALAQFEREFTDLAARLEAAFVVDAPDDDARDDASGTFGAYREEVERFLTDLRKALAPWEPKPKPKPKRKLSLAGDHPNQSDLADETGKRGEDAS